MKFQLCFSDRAGTERGPHRFGSLTLLPHGRDLQKCIWKYHPSLYLGTNVFNRGSSAPSAVPEAHYHSLWKGADYYTCLVGSGVGMSRGAVSVGEGDAPANMRTLQSFNASVRKEGSGPWCMMLFKREEDNSASLQK